MAENSSPYTAPTSPAEVARQWRLWPWFVAGFLVVFVGMSLTMTMYSQTASGDAVVACKLWDYYFVEVQKALHASGNLGPRTGSSSTAIATLYQHLICSFVGGFLLVGIGWGVRKMAVRKSS